MNFTRRDPQAVANAVQKLNEAHAALSGVLVLLTEAERASVPRVRSEFPEAGRLLANASAAHPELVALTEYDAEAVTEDLPDRYDELPNRYDELPDRYDELPDRGWATRGNPGCPGR